MNIIWILLPLSYIVLATSQELRSDPAPIIYPGQVNIGLLSNVHGPSRNGTEGCGTLRPEAVKRAMASVWAAHQSNFWKDDPQELNIGIYIYDTCGREDVAERQIYRLLGHVGHVQTTDCSEKRIPPLFAVITEGDSESLKVPLKLLSAFSVPVISTSGPTMPQIQLLSTAHSTETLAKAAVSVLRKMGLFDVAVMAEDDPPTSLFRDFSAQAQVSGMQPIQVEQATEYDDDDFLSTLKMISQYGKSRLKAVVFLLGPEQALHLLRTVNNTSLPEIPWVIVTPSDIASEIISTFSKKQLRKLEKVLILSPKSTTIPEFETYFNQLLEEDTIKYHPLLQEYLQVVSGNKSEAPPFPDLYIDTEPTTLQPMTFRNVTVGHSSNISPSDVSATVKAIWTLAAALKSVQKRSCRRGTDCLLYLRRSLSSYVARAATGLDYMMDHGAESLKGERLKFKEDGSLISARYILRGFTPEGDMKEVGAYNDYEGLDLDATVLQPITSHTFTESTAVPTTTTPEPDIKFKLKPDRVLPSPNPTPSNATEKEFLSSVLPINAKDYLEWKILDDTSVTEMSTEKIIEITPRPISGGLESDIDLVVAVHEEDLQNIGGNRSSTHRELEEGRDVVIIGPSYRGESRDSSSSNMRSISLTSHHEPRLNDAYRAEPSPNQIPNVPKSSPTSTEDVKVIRAAHGRHVSAWLGRPWALSVLGVCGILILITLYVLVFLMVKACEGTLKKTNCCLAGTQLVSLLCLYLAAALYTWKPSALLCGLQRLMPNVSLAFCYGCLLLKGMYLRAQNNLGLGGSVNRCNQMLTLLFIVGVQVALETQWWLIRPPVLATEALECSIGKIDILESQGYVAFLLLLNTALAVSTRKIPYNQPESRSLIITSLSCLMIFLSWDIACWLLPDAASRNIAAPSTLMATALVVLLGVFGPQLVTIHKYGGFPHKPLSYADSLSTVFTMFKDLDNASSSGTTARGKKNAKTLETPFAAELGEGTRNPLYNDYQSAYP
ncbi:uncharacterized protein LOC129231254 [Uloborus diversus]|uniref:uncharacterized protein LOC129231254 n=1 Tax=Uloborus diversus TaxID=327109 RepID=UPI002409D4A3|nr:uncharacterized protein LOC129231254 [Uloborus diversus]